MFVDLVATLGLAVGVSSTAANEAQIEIDRRKEFLSVVEKWAKDPPYIAPKLEKLFLVQVGAGSTYLLTLLRLRVN